MSILHETGWAELTWSMSDSGFILRLQVLKDSVLEATAALTFLINSPVGCREEEANLGAILTGWILACNPNR